MRLTPSIYFSFSLLLIFPVATRAEDGAADRAALEEAGVPTDGAGLLKFLRDRTPPDADRARLAERVAELSVRSFRVRERASRELVKAGPAAVPQLCKADAA